MGHARLTDAKLLLRDAGSPPLASSLAKEIEDALHDLQAPTVLDQLQVHFGSLGDDAAQSVCMALQASTVAGPLAVTAGVQQQPVPGTVSRAGD